MPEKAGRPKLGRILIPLVIYVVVPLMGLAAYARLCLSMLDYYPPEPPAASIFVLFATYGGWLTVFLTAAFWECSGMASLGILYLVFIAPFVCAGIAWRLYPYRASTIFHLRAFQAAAGYVLFLPIAFVAARSCA